MKSKFLGGGRNKQEMAHDKGEGFLCPYKEKVSNTGYRDGNGRTFSPYVRSLSVRFQFFN